ncbi:MAG: DUF5687 family protein [Bacteroidota bacterium]
MRNWILQHQRKSILRSPSYGNNTAVNVFLIILLIIMLLYMLAAGFVVDKLIESAFPERSVIEIFNSFIIYYFLADLFMRFYLQDVPAMEVRPYLLLPIKKSKIIHFLLTKSVLTFFNLIPIFLTVPFALKQVLPVYGTFGVVYWLASIYALVLCNSFLTVYLKKKLSDKPLIPIIFSLLLLGVAGMDYLNIFSLNNISISTFNIALQGPFIAIIVIAVLSGIYFIGFSLLKKSLYLESLSTGKKTKVYSGDQLLFLSKFGNIGELIALEIKLMLRNKRPKSLVTMSFFFLFYGLIFYFNSTYTDGFVMLIFIGIFITGSLVLNYGQFSFSWESSYFDFLLTKKIDLEEYITAKYYLFAVSIMSSFLLSIPYLYFGWKIVLINLACALFNIGVNSLSMFYFVGKAPKRIDISKSTVFNYEGVGAAQFVMIIPILVLPMLLYWVVSLIAGSWGGIAAIALVGTLSILFRNTLIKLFVQRFLNHKYTVASSLRAE